jgi:hypothetical protein
MQTPAPLAKTQCNKCTCIAKCVKFKLFKKRRNTTETRLPDFAGNKNEYSRRNDKQKVFKLKILVNSKG